MAVSHYPRRHPEWCRLLHGNHDGTVSGLWKQHVLCGTRGQRKARNKVGGIIRGMTRTSPSGSTLSLRRQPPSKSRRPCHDIAWLGPARFAHLCSCHNPITACWEPCIHTTNRTFDNSVPLLYPTVAPGKK